MNKKIILILLGISFLTSYKLINPSKEMESKSLWQRYYMDKKEKRKRGIPGDKEYRIGEIQKYFDGLRIPFGGSESGYPSNYLMTEYNKLRSRRLKSVSSPVDFIKRGPNNIGGRTRDILIDPSDNTHLTWYAGSATGGAWKTNDGGKTWNCITDGLPYQATTTLAISTINPEILYLGTGESFDGSIYTTGGGVFKSVDAGQNWKQLESTANTEDFRFVNRIVVDPGNPENLFVATTKGIFKSLDGGVSWQQKFEGGNVEQIISDTSNFNRLFATVKNAGIIKSDDEGENWEHANKGIQSRERIEIAMSPQNPMVLFASVSRPDLTSDLYYSNDGATHWKKVINSSNDVYDFLGGQGMYDNTVACHPYNENIVFWGGVNLWKALVVGSSDSVGAEVTDFYGIHTNGFFEFVDFGGVFPGIDIGENEGTIGLQPDDYFDIELRFGSGKSQKAHRFFVPEGATSGVPAEDYTYQDYINVPFEVWDITNNRQLMCSFRDQERDGVFNLYPRTGQGYGELSREYIFVHAIDYSELSDSGVINQGRSYKLNYFFWLDLIQGAEWNESLIPESMAVVDYEGVFEQTAEIVNISDAYEEYGGNNSYGQSVGVGKQVVQGLHPDHHDLEIIPTNINEEEFWIVNSNDGGLALSIDTGVSFTQISNNYLTTQFYSVAKQPGQNTYIGGMQDNGVWQSVLGDDADSLSKYYFRLSGDGFDVLWNQSDQNKILASKYNNRIFLSKDRGGSWQYASGGINHGESPFVTKLSNSVQNPDKVFGVGTEGIYISNDFGESDWGVTVMPEQWLGVDSKVTSSHEVEVSKASNNVVWAGAAMNEEMNYRIFVSQNFGRSFLPVNLPDYDMPFYISGIETHPTNPNEAFVLYGAYSKPKVLRTYDLGQSWLDISGFNNGGNSSNGFPDVGCFSLLVFPSDTNIIWIGTEIGIVESANNGIDWHLLDCTLPAVTVYSLLLQDNQIIVGTYGKGIWTCELQNVIGVEDIKQDQDITEYEWELYPNPASKTINFNLKGIPPNLIDDISIYDLQGKLVSEINYKHVNMFSYNLEPHIFNSGNYIVAIRLKNDEILTTKLLIYE